MTFLTKDELRRLLTVVYARNRGHHLALLVAFLHGLRVSEVLAIRGADIVDGQLSVRRLKNSRATIHAIRTDTDPVFDESVIVGMAETNSGRLFKFSRQRLDEILKKSASKLDRLVRGNPVCWTPLILLAWFVRLWFCLWRACWRHRLG